MNYGYVGHCMLNRNYKIYPYISAEAAFLGFVEDFREFNKNNLAKFTYELDPRTLPQDCAPERFYVW